MPRLFDLLLTLLVAPVLLPLCLLTALLVRINLGAPVLFRQPRGGLHGHIFHLWKFRSMTSATNADGDLLPDAERLTRFGKFLRASSLDELPSFFNLIKGDLRLVGPRPLLVEYLPLYSAEQKHRHDVAPGITGWAQVKGRNAIGWDEKFTLDLWYVRNRSWWVDLKILGLTLIKIFSRDDINAAGHATMPRFTGSRENGE
jgi:sugar transferase EpsL